ncbi:hypothetical protein Pcinc_030737 [Petrolisthes cinctipes]|uniref:LIM zinc-binding domain-containing protein n=1 Tax=Petrolisthes cinctipes TaxID=88211 RepID=A0AAE1K5L4_PETCI|nr:hypothetical protein Pcinc_030737 [Petrolisthes cinctipes]
MSHVTVVQVQEAQLKSHEEKEEDVLLHHVSRDSTTTTTGQHRCKQEHFQVPDASQGNNTECGETVDCHDAKTEYGNFKNLKEKEEFSGAPDQTDISRSVDEMTLRKTHESKRLCHRSNSILDQNVGVTGSAVLMVSDPAHLIHFSDAESESSITSSVSSLSESSDSGLSSTVEVGASPTPHHSTTIAIGDQDDCRDNRVLVHVVSRRAENEHVTNGDAADVKPEEGVDNSDGGEVGCGADGEVMLEWRVIPPSSQEPQQQQQQQVDAADAEEGDRGSTPTSFSSAYTVTENENESTTSEHENESEESEASRLNWSGQESEDELHEARRRRDGVPHSTSTSEDEASPPQVDSLGHDGMMSSNNNMSELQPGGENTLSSLALPGSSGGGVMGRLRHSSGGSSGCEGSIVFSYIPCRDQREKEDEELWVANEAADPRGSMSYQGPPVPPLLPPPEGWGGSLGHVAGKPEARRRESVWGEQLRPSHGCVVSPACVASLMCTLAPSLAHPPQVGGTPSSRRHYSTRQRMAEAQIIQIVEEEPKYKQNWNNLKNNTNSLSEKIILETSSSTNVPTKRFSFLIRSNSVKQELSSGSESLTTTAVTKAKQPVTPSDQAILDKLATLNIETPEVVLKPQLRCSLFEPPCVRCGEPVYAQERMEPTLRLVYHSSCFKCYQCGVRLTLKTFFRSPLDSADSRVFCKSHVPSLDPGRVGSTVSSRVEGGSQGKGTSTIDTTTAVNTNNHSRASNSSSSSINSCGSSTAVLSFSPRHASHIYPVNKRCEDVRPMFYLYTSHPWTQMAELNPPTLIQ